MTIVYAYILSAVALVAVAWLAWELRKVKAQLLEVTGAADAPHRKLEELIALARSAASDRLDEHEAALTGIKSKLEMQKATAKRGTRWPRMA